MAQFTLGSAAPNLLFVLFSTQTLFWAAVILLALFVFHLVRCAKRGVCPFPHGRKKLKVSSGGTASLKPGQNPNPNQITQSSLPLAPSDPIRTELLSDLQGNILTGHGRDFAVHLFVKFTGDATAARSWLRDVAKTYVVSAASQYAKAKAFRKMAVDGGIFGHISLSATGYKALGFQPNELAKAANPRGRREDNGYRDVFADGMKARRQFLLDPEVESWDTGYHGEVDVLIILAAGNQASVDRAATLVVESLTDTAGGTIGHVVARENGLGLTRQLDADDPSTVVHVEHFGYMDGRSQPLFLQEQVDRERANGGISTWDPTAPLSLALVRDPLGKTDMSCGSFLVFRKLEQNVRAWNRSVNQLADELGVKADLAGAMAMGRFKDGTPVIGQGEPGRTDVYNDFDFKSDPQGRRCPFQAHIRKANPRGEAVGEGDDTVEEERSHRIVRRGIPYGGALTTSSNPDEQPEGGVGLLFFCYQGDIWEQFEFIQRHWCNNPYFLQPQKTAAPGYDKTGLDPVIGQAHPTAKGAARPPGNWPQGWDQDTTKVKAELANFVTMKGGEYFFSPSVSFLLGL
jgi:Dyp-type peroxidase family